MSHYAVKIVDAFTTARYAGNPCGVVTRAEGLTDAQMQAIARELNLSETAFVLPSAVADFRVRFFTPRMEIPLAGHPTIATMHALAEEGRIDLSDGPRRVTQELLAGVLPVDLEHTPSGHARIVMTQATPQFGEQLDPAALAQGLGVPSDAIRADVRPQVVSTGTPQGMVAVTGLRILESLQPDLQRLTALERAHGYFSLHVFALESYDPAHRVHSRHFAGSAGIPEDPVTGSATGAMAAYLWRTGLLREPRYSVEQGHIMGRPGIVQVEVDATGETPEVVRIAGSAVTVLTGTITV